MWPEVHGRPRTALANPDGEGVRGNEEIPKEDGKEQRERPRRIRERSLLEAKGEESFKRQRTANSVKCYREFE